MSAATYVLATGEVGRDRLRVLSAALADSTSGFLDRIGIAADARCLDVGCGGGDVAVQLARRAPAGTVVGIDSDPVTIEIARMEAGKAGLSNVEYRVADATQLDRTQTGDGFDLAYARFLLCHVPDPKATVRGLLALLRPRGILAIEEIDIDGSVCWPRSASFDRSCELFVQLVALRGGDANLGRRLPSLLAGLGLDGLRVSLTQPAGLTGAARMIQALTLGAIEPGLIHAGLATAGEIAVLKDDLAHLIGRDDTVISTARIVQAFATKPCAEQPDSRPAT